MAFMNKDMWCNYDFEVNKHHWLHVGIEKAEAIRKKNLIDLSGILKTAEVTFWLQGQTLLGAYKYGKLLDDHDDDIGVDHKLRDQFEDNITGKLEAIGFEMIRNSQGLISYVRDNRYIDICFFENNKKKYGYRNKWFPRKHFEHFDTIEFLGKKMLIPNNTESLLYIMYEKYNLDIGYKLLKYLVTPTKYRDLLRKISYKLINTLPHHLKKNIVFLFSPLGISYREITLDELNSTLIEPEDSFNWKWRKPHLDIITNNKKYISITEIVNYIGDENGLNQLLTSVRETDTSTPFYCKHNFDPRFWQSGNNYFIYNIKYQFRKGVASYSSANQYISEKKMPLLYTSDYYESLTAMTEEEIQAFLLKNPIEIRNGAITSGKHRVTAMIGRILSNKPYIPFWAVVIDY